jgi:excisionase family DNA binding protein
MDDERTLVTVKECARMLALGRSKVYKLLESGAIRSISIGRARRIPRVAIFDFVAAMENAESE